MKKYTFSLCMVGDQKGPFYRLYDNKVQLLYKKKTKTKTNKKNEPNRFTIAHSDDIAGFNTKALVEPSTNLCQALFIIDMLTFTTSLDIKSFNMCI